MFAKQTLLSASLVALLGAPTARADGDPSSDDEVAAPGTTEPLPAPDPPKPPTGTFQIGAGYSSDEGFIATASIVQPDLFHTGNLLGLWTQISAERQLFLLRFSDPDLFGTKWSLTTDLFNTSRQLPGFRRNEAGASLTVGRSLGHHVRAFVGYHIGEVEAVPDAIARTITPTPQPQSGLLSAVRAGVEYNTLDQPWLPTQGTRIGASYEIADRHLGSDLEFARVRAWGETHQPLGPFTFHLSGSLTAVSPNAPLSERLFLESSREIRGYSRYSLGGPVGGEVKALGRAELELPLIRRIGLSAVGFLDAGTIMDQAGQGGVGRSLGFGLLWRSPIGPLRFDWAFPMGGGGPVFGFGIGGGLFGEPF